MNISERKTDSFAGPAGAAQANPRRGPGGDRASGGLAEVHSRRGRKEARSGDRFLQRNEACHRMRFRLGRADAGVDGAGCPSGRRGPDDALHVFCDCRSDFAGGRDPGFRGRRRGHVQPGCEPDGRRPGGASQGSRDHSGALVWRLRRHGPDHEDGERARDSGDRRRRAIDRFGVQGPPGRQYRTDWRFQLFPEQEPGRVRRRRDHDDGRCGAGREADGAAGPRPHGKVLPPMDRRQFAAGFVAGRGAASKAAVSGWLVCRARAKRGTLPCTDGGSSQFP